jgi:hypothetical protein
MAGRRRPPAADPRCVRRSVAPEIGGAEITLAVQDAVAANIFTGSLRRARYCGEPVPESATVAVQRRRWLPTVVTQAFQRLAQLFGIDRALRGDVPPEYRAIGEIRFVSRLPGLLIRVGVLPEQVRAPAYATPRSEP